MENGKFRKLPAKGTQRTLNLHSATISRSEYSESASKFA